MKKIYRKIPPEILKDRKLVPLVKKFGQPDLKNYHGKISAFDALLRSIIYQQLSGRAARTIHKRFRALFRGGKPTPKAVLAVSEKSLRVAGLSRAKVLYVKDLAAKFASRSIPHRSFRKMPNEKIMEHLTAVKGIGEWTAHMFLMFTLHRPDILPVGDLAIRKGFQKIYNLARIPERADMERIAKPWRNHASVACWYIWRVMDDLK